MKVLAFIFMICCFNKVSCTDDWAAYFNVLHKGIEGVIIVKTLEISDSVKLMGNAFEKEDQVQLDGQNKEFELVANSTTKKGKLGISKVDSTGNNLLLTFTVQKSDKDSPAKIVDFITVPGIIAILYRPSMGGGDNFVLALGHQQSDVSSAVVQEVLATPSGYQQTYFPLCVAKTEE